VGRLTVSKKKYEAVKEQMWVLIDRAEALRHELTLAMAEDAAAFEAILAAFKLPKETEAEQAARNQAVQNATLHAAEIPLTVAAKSLEVMEMALEAAKAGNSNAITDAGTGATLAKAALTSACYNVRTNVLGLEDEAQAKRLLAAVRELESRAETVNESLRSVLQERGGLPLS
ncbi:MAG TPA: cyclodeaminase/cyclohydrolase family protein, partial [Anaerolineaceae bacterium]|nr:cyclodeaminase/cyclohydrolase family protein [Anaerolineaceae bacterium]